MIALTAATGHLGRLALTQLLAQVPAQNVVAVVRNPAKAADLAAQGVTVRAADYNDPAALERAFAGVEKLLLISGSEVGQRAVQHRNVIEAARRAGVTFIAYTSLLRADRTPLSLGTEHRATELTLQSSGVPHVILRNGWYHENYTQSVKPALANGAFVGSAGTGRIAGASRADYAAAAVAALLGKAEPGRIYELAGDHAYTLADLAAEVSRQAGRDLPYHNLPPADYTAILEKVGLPSAIAQAIAGWDVDASNGALFDDSRELSRLIGHPTTPLADAVRAALVG